MTKPVIPADRDETMQLIRALTNRLDGLEQRIDSARSYVNESIAQLPDFIDERLHRLHIRIDHTDERITALKKAAPVDVNVTADTESLTAFVGQLETLVRDIEKELKESIAAGDRARVRGDDAMHDLVTRTANSLYAEIKKLTDYVNGQDTKILDLERSVENYNGLTGTQSAPQRDTSWHPHDAIVDVCPVSGADVVVVMWSNGFIQGPHAANTWTWNTDGGSTIVAWRYAKEGE